MKPLNPLLIRSDLSHLPALSVLAEEWDYDAASAVLETLKDPAYQFFLLFHQAEVLGGVYILQSAFTVDILYLYIRKDKRRQHLGLVLLEQLVSVQLPKSVQKIVLEVRRQNTAAQKLYESFGFSKVRTIPKYYKDGEDAFVYVFECCFGTRTNSSLFS